MARTVLPLTDLKIKGTNETKTLTDGNGLQLKVVKNKNGDCSKIWQFKYYKPDSKKRTNITIGKYPKINLAKARKKREEYSTLLSQGIDPVIFEIEKKEKPGTTFGVVARKWFEWRKGKRDFAEVTAKKAWMRIENYLIPHFDKKPIDKILPLHVIQALEPLKQDGKLETINRLLQLLNSIMTYALNTGLINYNPLANVKEMYDKPKTQNRPALPLDDFPEFIRDLQVANTHRLSFLQVLWQMLTLARPAEASRARFDQIDEKAMTWSYYILKGNKENEKGRLHVVPLTRQTVALLKELKGMRIPGNPYIFANNLGGTGHASLELVNNVIKKIKKGKYKGRQTGHGLRAVASTWLNEQRLDNGARKYDADLIEVAFSHMNKDPVRSAYNRASYLEPRRQMLQDWADFVQSCGAVIEEQRKIPRKL